MKRAVLYLRVSTIDQTTANQERELREIAARMGCEITKVYKDHGISGAKGRDKRPAFDALCRDATKRQFDVIMAWSVDRLGRSLQDLGRLPIRTARPADRPIPASAGPRHHDAGGQGDVSDDGRVCRVRARDDPGTGPCWPGAGQERGETARTASDSSRVGRAHQEGSGNSRKAGRAQDR